MIRSTLFSGKNWMLSDAEDPLSSWNLGDVLQANIGPATNDRFGKLYGYLQSLLCKFYRRLATLEVEFQVHSQDIRKLPAAVGEQKFARIEVRN